MKKPEVCIVVAMGENREIGKSGKLLWHIPEDMKRFKALTLGHPVIMGRKTFESILSYLGKPLPGRTNIVVTRDQGYTHEGALIAHTLDEAFELAKRENPQQIHIGGGAQLYAQALSRVDKLYLTLVEDAPEADTYFPRYDGDFVAVREERREHNGLSYRWVDFERRR